jgi:hypothetical protein
MFPHAIKRSLHNVCTNSSASLAPIVTNNSEISGIPIRCPLCRPDCKRALGPAQLGQAQRIRLGMHCIEGGHDVSAAEQGMTHDDGYIW